MTGVTHSLTYQWRIMFEAALLAILLAVILLAGCAPNEEPQYNDAAGTYIVSTARLLGRDNTFSIKDDLVYPENINRGIITTSLNISDKELAIARCSWCHACGFEDAWDWENYGSSDWSPRYVGEEWGPIVVRMKDKEMSFLQEEMIARRVYEYLRDDSLGVYDESADDKGAVRIEVDELPAPVDTSPVLTPGSGAGIGKPDAPEEGDEGEGEVTSLAETGTQEA